VVAGVEGTKVAAAKVRATANEAANAPPRPAAGPEGPGERR
jgi:hypothetical protein